MKVDIKRSLLGLCVAGALLSPLQASAAGRLVVYCSATNAMCEAETKAFSENTMYALPWFATAREVPLLKLKRKKQPSC